MPLETNGRITRTDLEAAFARTWGEGREQVSATFPQSLLIAGALALVVVAVAFLLGKRRGRRRSPVIEIRRL